MKDKLQIWNIQGYKHLVKESPSWELVELQVYDI